MTVLAITGASGYLGGRLAQLARSVDSLTVRPVTRADASWLGPGTVHIQSLRADAARALEGADAVIHLAGANEIAARSDPDGALSETVAASRAVAVACAQLGVRRLIYLSTVHVYGTALTPGSRVDEETVPEPRGSYPVSRLASEHILASFSGDTKVFVLRLTNGVGRPASPLVERWTLVANDLCRQAVERGVLKISSPGQWRDFIPIGDVAQVIFNLVEREATNDISAGTYNLASARSITIRALADLISDQATAMGLGSIPIEAGPVDNPVAPYTVECDKLAGAGIRVLGTPLEHAVRETLEFCVSAFAKR